MGMDAPGCQPRLTAKSITHGGDHAAARQRSWSLWRPAPAGLAACLAAFARVAGQAAGMDAWLVPTGGPETGIDHQGAAAQHGQAGPALAVRTLGPGAEDLGPYRGWPPAS